MFIYNLGVRAINWAWPTATAPKRTTQELIGNLRAIFSSEDKCVNPSEQASSLLKDESFDFLKSAIFDLASKIDNERDLSVLENLLNYVDKHHRVSINIEMTSIDKLLEELEVTVSRLEASENKSKIANILRSFKNKQQFDVDGEPGDVEFCVQLETAQNLNEVRALATTLQIKSALVFLALRNSILQDQEQQFVSLMKLLLECAKSREIPLTFKSSDRSIFGLLTRKISQHSSRGNQVELMQLLYNDE